MKSCLARASPSLDALLAGDALRSTSCPRAGAAGCPCHSVTPLLCVTAGDAFLKPRLMGTTPCYLDQLCVRLHPSLEEFEEGLLEQLSSDRLLKVMPT